jgi:hypothetical protein
VFFVQLVFKSLIAAGSKKINHSPTVSHKVFAKFGVAETESIRMSQAYLLRGIGNHGLAKKTL